MADLERTQLDDSNLERASLVGVVAKGASFAKVNLRRGDLRGARFEDCDFSKVPLADPKSDSNSNLNYNA